MGQLVYYSTNYAPQIMTAVLDMGRKGNMDMVSIEVMVMIIVVMRVIMRMRMLTMKEEHKEAVTFLGIVL